MNDVTKRFIETYKSLGLTGYRMGKQSSVITKQKISNIEKGVTEVSSEILSDFFSNYSEVNPDYVLTGEGKRLKDDKSIIELEQIPTEEKIGKFFTENTNGVKFYDLGNGKYRMLVKHVPFVPMVGLLMKPILLSRIKKIGRRMLLKFQK